MTGLGWDTSGLTTLTEMEAGRLTSGMRVLVMDVPWCNSKYYVLGLVIIWNLIRIEVIIG